MANDTITLTEAARRLGVHYMTAYRYVRTGRLPAAKEGAVWRVETRDVDDLKAGRRGSAAVGGPPALGPGAGRRRRRDHHLRLEDRILAGDEQGAWAIVEGALTAGLDPDQIYLDVLAPALALVGEGWESGRVTVAEEHQASAVVLRLIGRLGPRFVRRGRKRGTVVLGAPAGDHHGIPVALAADLLRQAGFAVVDLGADTPAQSFVDAARQADRLVGVGVSATTGGNAARIRRAVRAVHDGVGCPVVLGGRAVAETDGGIDATLGADELSTSTSELVSAFDRLSRLRPAAGPGGPTPV